MKNLPLGVIAFLEATSAIIYCLLTAQLISGTGNLFGQLPEFFNPGIFLFFLLFSGIVALLVYFGYPFILIFEKKQTANAIKLVLYSILWTIFLLLALLFTLPKIFPSTHPPVSY